MSGSGPSAGTQGFLFCDLRGYARFVDAHGDAAAAELLATYRGLVRAVLANHAGAEIRTEGDSVYVVFGAASAAVQAGLDIIAAAATASTPDRPIRVGVGVHAGETIATGEGPVGGAVNIAARVCAKAQAGELLVTDTVRSLTRTLLPYRFVGLGGQRLKGVGTIPLYRVEATSAGRFAHARRRLVARRRRVVGIALVAALALVGATAGWAVSRPPECLALGRATHDVVARIDPARGCVMAVYPVGANPSAIAISSPPDGAPLVWVASANWTVTVVNARTGTARSTGVAGVPLDIALTSEGDLMVLVEDNTGPSDKRVELVGAADARVQVGFGLPVLDEVRDLLNSATPGYSNLAVTSDRLLITDVSTGDVATCPFNGVGFDELCWSAPTRVHIKDAAQPQGQPQGQPYNSGLGPIVVAGQAAWIADLDAPTLYLYTPGSEIARLPIGGSPTNGTQALATTGAVVWALRNDGTLTRIDTATHAQASIPGGATLSSFAASADSLWVGDPKAAAIRRLDPSNGAPLATVALGGEPAGLAIAPDGSVWVAISTPTP